MNFLPMASLKTPGMNEYSSHGMTIYAMPKDEAEVERIAMKIADSRDRVNSALGTTNDHGIDVIIYPDRAALKRKTLGFAGLFLPSWYIGKNSRDRVLICSPANPGPSHTRESVEQAAVHEYVHVLTDRRNKDMDYWLKEGFALYLAHQKPTANAVRKERDITFREFNNPNALQFAEVGGYTLAYTLLEYLEQEYGWERVLQFLEPGRNCRKITGLEKRDFFKEWKAWLMTI